MRNIVLIMLFPLLSFSQPKDSVKVKDSIEIVQNLKKLDKINSETKKLLYESKKIKKERNSLLDRLTNYIKDILSENKKEPDISDIQGLKPEQHEPLEEPKEVTEQKPRSGFLRWLKNIFTKHKPDEENIISTN